MKKFIIFLIFAVCTNSVVIARDYTKLQIKEMKKAQKYGTTKNYVNQNVYAESINIDIKDPGVMRIGNYEIVDDKKFDEKIKSDEKYYAKVEKSLKTKTWDNYNAQAKGSDYYHVYRIAEKIIRANKLDYINWRIGFTRNPDMVNAYSTATNYIDITTAAYDSFADNDDALALLIGHEMGHSLLGHQRRLYPLQAKYQKLSKIAPYSPIYCFSYIGYKLKYKVESKNAEFAADVEGAKLALKAGYDLNKGQEMINYLNTLPYLKGYKMDHPDGQKRVDNIRDNCKYLPQKAWQDYGKYNIYNSEPLKVNLSSDRKSIVISSNPKNSGDNNYYAPETLAEIYARMGYKAYTNGDFDKSLKYFNELFKIDKSNSSAYLYASYASEALYKKTGKNAYLEDAKVYAESAKILDPNNKYVLEQIDVL